MSFMKFIETRDYSTVQYHGTSFENAKNIVVQKQGLIPDRPLTTSGPGINAVYLTPNIKLAARYSIGGLSKGKLGRIPAVLEIKLYDSRRHNKMQPDALDRSDTAWSDHEERDDFGNDVQEIENEILRFIQLIAKRYGFQSPSHLNLRQYQLEELQNFDIHDYVRGYLEKIFTTRWKMVKNDINRYLNTGTLSPGTDFADGKIEITNSGIMKLTPDYWHKQHQNLYQNKVHYKAVKSVWIRKSDFPDAVGEEENFGVELLPSEVVDEFEGKKKALENLEDHLDKAIDEEDINWSLDQLTEIKDDLESDSDLSDDKISQMIEELIEKVENGDFDYKLISKIGDRAREMSSYLYDDYNSSKTIENNKTIWIKMTPENFAKLT